MSLTINPVGWFEIPAADLQRAKSFYEFILNCKLDVNNFGNLKMAWFPFDQEKTGSTGSLVEAESYVPSYNGSMVYFVVDDIEGVLKRVSEKGGKVITPKMSIGQYGFVGHFEDSEGNRLGLHSMN
jgi:predicted enzyme related to lactoylglutathione lyase